MIDSPAPCKYNDPFLQALKDTEFKSLSESGDDLDPFNELWNRAWRDGDEDGLLRTTVDQHGRYRSLHLPDGILTDSELKSILVVKEYEQLYEDMSRWFDGWHGLWAGKRDCDEGTPWDGIVSDADESKNEERVDERLTCGLERYFLIVGNSGIGKTTSLYYILTRRLLARQPTFLHNTEQTAYYLCDDGAFSFDIQSLSCVSLRKARSSTKEHLLLMDADSYQRIPHENWVLGMNLRIVEATSSRPGRVDWVEKRSYMHYRWLMRPMPLTEFLLAYCCHFDDFALDPDTKDWLVEFYNMYGPSLRNAIQSCASRRDLDAYETGLQDEINELTCDKLSRLLRDMSQLVMDSQISHRILVIMAGPERYKYCGTFVSQHVWDMISKRLGSGLRGVKGRNFERFLGNTRTSAAAEYIFRVRIDELFQAGLWPSGGTYRI